MAPTLAQPPLPPDLGGDPCLEGCVYSNSLRHIPLGILGFSLSERRVIFRNARALQHLGSEGELDFDHLTRLFFPDPETSRREEASEPRQVEIGGRALEFQHYCVAGNFVWVFLRDATEEQRTRAQLAASEERFHTFAAAATDAIVLVDARGDITYWNPAAEAIFGWSAAEVMGRNLHRLITTPEAFEAFQRGFQRFIETGQSRVLGRATEFTARRKDGTLFPVEVSALAVRLGSGWHAAAFARDISDRKRVAAELKRSKELFQTVADFATDWIYWKGADGRLLYVAPACEKITGYSPEEFYARPELVDGLVHPDDRHRWEQHSETAFSEGTPSAVEFRILTKGGQVRWIRHVCRAIRGEGGAFAGVRGSNTDVTARKRAEDERARLVAALESTADAVCLTDLDGVVQYVNPAFQTICGWSQDDALGKPLASLCGPEKGASALEENYARVRAGEVWSGAFTSRRRDGGEFQAEATLAPVRSAAGVSSLVAVVRDVTERTRLMSIAEAVNTMDNIGYVFSGIRHELGNPINSIKMTLSVLDANLDKYSKEQVREYVDRSLSEIARVEYLLKALKNFNMFESPELKEVALATFLERFRSLVEAEFAKRGIDLRFTHDPDARIAFTDPRALQQVLLNVLTNAADATEGRESPSIELSVGREASGKVCIRVLDNGVGMTAAQQENLFKPFHTTKARGTGLGLIITKKLLSKMGGDIAISSRRGEGTAVELHLPEGPR